MAGRIYAPPPNQDNIKGIEMTDRIIPTRHAIKKTRLVEYWSCGIDAKQHWHKSERVANNCIEKNIGAILNGTQTKKWSDGALLAIVKMVDEDGMSMREVGKKVGWLNDPDRPLTGQSISRLYHRWHRKNQRGAARDKVIAPETNRLNIFPVLEEKKKK